MNDQMISGTSGYTEPELEYALKGTSQRLRDAEALIQKLTDVSLARERTIQRVRDWLAANRFHLGETLDKTYGFNQAVNQVRSILDGE